MSKRFGRNQRRKLREELEHVTKQRDSYQNAYWAQRDRVDHAINEALQRILGERDKVEYYLERIVDQLAHQLGSDLAPHAEKILASARQRSPILSFEASELNMPHGQTVIVLRGRIAPLQYNITML